MRGLFVVMGLSTEWSAWLRKRRDDLQAATMTDSARAAAGIPACVVCGYTYAALNEEGVCVVCQPCSECGEVGGACHDDVTGENCVNKGRS